MGTSGSLVYRRALLWVVGGMLAVVAVIAASYVIGLRERAIERERIALQGDVEDLVASWEDDKLDELSRRLEQVASDPNRAANLQTNWKRWRPWFDSLFLWFPPGTERTQDLVFPVPATAATKFQIQSSPCIQRARLLQLRYPTDFELVARALVEGCRHEPPTIRLTAGVQAASLYLAQEHFADALGALEATAEPDATTLRGAARQGVDPFRLAAHRSQTIDVLLRTDHVDQALDLALQLGRQITELDAPDLPAMSIHMREIPRVLEQHGHAADAQVLEVRVERAERRMRAYEEVTKRLLLEEMRPDATRFVYDQYSDDPYLLYYGWSGIPNNLGVAFVLEQGPLLEELLQTRMRRLRGAVTIVDAERRYVSGAKAGGAYVVVVPFTKTLTHLRVAVRQVALDNTVATMNEQWIVPLVVIGLCFGLAMVALAGIDRTMRQQFELLDRQRAFSTRVTHELKTPLAGIRVMAENLELGAFKDERQRREMAHRIVEESDRLTRRVDEVLAVAKERTIPSPEPFDLEEVLYEAIDEWGPRMQDAGVELAADLGATDPVLGDAKAMRDAVACLLDNALKYRREDAQSRVWLTLAQDGRVVEVSVADNGIGVPKAMRKRIFERFVRVEGPNRGKAGGHGLGLHQVREIVAAHRGTVASADGVDGGAKFVIRLPAMQAEGSAG